MSTKIGIITEGPIDELLLSALLEQIAKQRASLGWPIHVEEARDYFPIRKRGAGGVLNVVKSLVQALSTQPFDHFCFVILLDRRTKPVQRKIHRLISGKTRFVLAIAVEEIEAWWLGDRSNTLAWADLAERLPDGCRYAMKGYRAERDKQPKKTLDELTRHSNKFDRFYGDGSVELASDFADAYWRTRARLQEICTQCPQGFRPFQDEMTNRFRQMKTQEGRLC
jgi:hypothetical protein